MQKQIETAVKAQKEKRKMMQISEPRPYGRLGQIILDCTRGAVEQRAVPRIP